MILYSLRTPLSFNPLEIRTRHDGMHEAMGIILQTGYVRPVE